MQLTKFTDYALRTLLFCASKPVDRCRLQDIADAFDVSKNHLSKVIHKLGELDYLKTTRGKNGGIALARDASEINIGEVVRACEPSFTLLECFDAPKSTCPLTDHCILQTVLEKARDSFMRELDFFSLADVAKASEKPLKKIMAEHSANDSANESASASVNSELQLSAASDPAAAPTAVFTANL